MSTYSRLTKHPITGKWQNATWMDDYFGQHNYGVRFPDGSIFNPKHDRLLTKDGEMSGSSFTGGNVTVEPREEKLEWWEEPCMDFYNDKVMGGVEVCHGHIRDYTKAILKEERRKTLEMVKEIVATAESHACGFTCDCGESHAGNVKADITARLVLLQEKSL